MSDFRKVANKKELYIGFVDDQDKYDKFGFCRNTSYVYFGQYNSGVKDGYGAFVERGSEGSINIGNIFNDSINGIGIHFLRGVVYFGYFQNGIFESGFKIGNELSFVSKKHNNYELTLFKETDQYFRFELFKFNNGKLEKEKTKPIEISRDFDTKLSNFKRDVMGTILFLNDSQIVTDDNFYGAIVLKVL